eukprot:jgi/Sobl393_1/12080/SZX66567.1
MIIDCPEWVAHRHTEGISAIDVHPNGRRLATCGTDPQIKIWNLLPILDPAAEADASVPKLLAALSEHQGSALVVAFSRSGLLLASGGNDNTVLLYKLHSGAATSKLGASFVNIENWKTVANIRGHSLDVTGLAWSPSDRQLATCSMDGSIMVFNVSADGAQHSPAHKLSGQHHGWVKGLAFDPLGRYLASQGRNGLKVWDAEAGWACVTHQKTPFDRAPETAFRHRISWSPDGELLLAVNASSGGQPTTVLFKRQAWDTTHLVGHRSSVVAAAANPRMFFAPRRLQAARKAAAERMARAAEGDGSEDGEEQQQDDAAAAAAAGGDGLDGFDDMPSMVCACSSNDKTFTVWSSELALPVLHCQQLHAGNIVDLAWTPDGYTLIAASNDDTISVIRFSEAELGRAMSDDQLRALLEQEYGAAAAAATGGGGPAAEVGPAGLADADLASITLGAAAAAAPAAAQATAPVPANGAPAPAAPAAAAAPSQCIVPQPVGSAAAAAPAAASSALARRLMPTGAGVTTGSLQQPTAAAASRKRAHPAGGGPAAAAPSAKRPALAVGNGAVLPGQQQQQQVLRPAAVGPGGGGSSSSSSSGWVLACPAVLSLLQLKLTEVHAAPDTQAAQQQPGSMEVVMSVQNHRPGSSGAAPVADICVEMCASGSNSSSSSNDVVWCDKVQGEVVAIAGTAFFSAAATRGGLLHTWRPGGNLLLPPLALGCPAARLEAQGDWGLLLAGVDGELALLDMQRCVREMGPTPSPSIRPLLAAAPPGTTLADIWVMGCSSSSMPQQQQQSVPRSHVAVLSDASGWMFHGGLGLWSCLRPGLHEPAGQAHRPGGFAAAAGNADAERL